MTSKSTNSYLFGISLRECLSITLFGVMIALSNFIHFPMHIPGHTGLIWLTILTFNCLNVRKPGSGTLAGIISGFLSVVLGTQSGGALVFFKYLLPGITMDLLFSFIPYMTKKWYLVALAAAFSHWTKLLCNYIIGTILNLPQGFLIMGVQIATINHFIFGLFGGILGYSIYSKLRIRMKGISAS